MKKAIALYVMSVVAFVVALLPPHDRLWIDALMVLVGIAYAIQASRAFSQPAPHEESR